MFFPDMGFPGRPVPKERVEMQRKHLNQSGMGVMEFLFWAAVAAVLAWLGWQLYLHPESLRPRPATHSVLEDTTPQGN